MENKPIKRKRKFVPGATKALLALTSVAGTVGLWNVISNQSLVEAQKAGSTIDETLQLAALPTVVPLAQVIVQPTQVPGAAPNPPLSSLRVVTPRATSAPVVQAPAKTAKPTAPAANSGSGSQQANPAISAPTASNPVVTAAPATPVPTTSTGSSK